MAVGFNLAFKGLRSQNNHKQIKAAKQLKFYFIRKT